MKNLYRWLLALLLAAFLAVGFWSLFDKDATESKTENRRLAAKPKLTVTGLLDGSYISALETYYSDTFPGREALLQVNKNMNKFYHYSGNGNDNMLILDFQGGMENGGEALKHPDDVPETPVEPTPDVPEEKDPEEVPVEIEKPEPDPKPVEPTPPEREEPTDYTTMGNIIIVGDSAMDVPFGDNAIIESYAEAVNNLHAALGNEVRVISLVTPNSAQFYTPKDFHTGDYDQKTMIDRCYGAMGKDIVTVDAFSKLAAHTDEYIYFRTDHHWTALGAYYAYTAFCEALDLEPVPLDQFETGTYENFVGSMYTYTSGYSQSEVLKNNPDTLLYYLPVVETHAKYYADASLDVGYPVSVVYRGLQDDVSNKYMCFLGGDHPAAVVETAVEDGPTCLVLKESYGNAFVPFLTSHYSKIVVIDPREFNRDGKPSLDLAAFAKEQGIDDLIVINYPFMINNVSYITWLNRLVGLE